MAIYELDGQAPDLPADGNYFIADTATVIGKIRLLSGASVWFGASGGGRDRLSRARADGASGAPGARREARVHRPRASNR